MSQYPDSWSAMVARVQEFHEVHNLKERGGEDLVYRVALMAEELGEISAAVTKGKDKSLLAEECADLLILLLGTGISADIDLQTAFWRKMDALRTRSARMVEGRVRVSHFDEPTSE